MRHAAGEMTSDDQSGGTFSQQYTWDAEERQTSATTQGVGTATYTYDGDGYRVKKSTGTLYWYAPWGEVLSETDTAGNMQFEYVYYLGRRILKVTPGVNGMTYLYFSDGIGSARVITNVNGGICEDSDYLPFGQEVTHTSTCPQNYKFTGMERDAETGNDHTLYRQYAWNFGRWLSPDPAGRKAVSLTDPQTWNMYTYAGDNPETLNDPSGLSPWTWLFKVVRDLDFVADSAGGVRADDSNLGQAARDQAAAKEQDAGTPAPTNPDGAPKPPPNPPPPGAGGKPNEWVRVPGTENRPDKWVPRDPVPSPKGGEPQGSWDEKGGHWDIDDGRGGRTRYLPDGTKVDHNNKPIPTTNTWDRIKSIPPQRVVEVGTAAVIIYIIVSEGSRLYLPRNLVPVP